MSHAQPDPELPFGPKVVAAMLLIVAGIFFLYSDDTDEGAHPSPTQESPAPQIDPTP